MTTIRITVNIAEADMNEGNAEFTINVPVENIEHIMSFNIASLIEGAIEDFIFRNDDNE